MVLVLLLIAGLHLIADVGRPLAVQIGAEVSGGYDSNAVLSAEETGSGFMRYRLWGEQPFLQSNAQITGTGIIQGAYQDFFDVSDNYRVSASADLQWHLQDKRIIPSLLGEATVYRNRELPEDDVNAVMIGGRLEWLTTPRLTLGGHQSFSWRDDAAATDASTIGTGGGGMRSGPGRGRDPAPADPINISTAGDEPGILSQTRLESTWYILPVLTADLSLAHNRMFSKDDPAEYSENGLIAGVQFEPAERWTLTAQAAYWDTKYDVGDYDADTLILDFWASRYFNKWEVFALARWLDKDASSAEDTYTQTLIECGISRIF